MTSKEKERAVEKIIDASETKLPGEQIVDDNTLVIDHDMDNELNDYLDNSIFKNIRTIDQNEIENSLVKQKISSDVEDMYSGTFSEITENSLIQGRVVGMNDRDVLIDIGFKSEGIIDRSEFKKEELPSIGDQVEVYLEFIEDASGNTILSKEKADFMKRWKELKSCRD